MADEKTDVDITILFGAHKWPEGLRIIMDSQSTPDNMVLTVMLDGKYAGEIVGTKTPDGDDWAVGLPVSEILKFEDCIDLEGGVYVILNTQL